MTVKVPWVKLPETKYKQLKNGMRGVVFRLSPQYVGKILYEYEEGEYQLRGDEDALEKLEYEVDICEILFSEGIGNVPKPVGIERLGLYGTSYPVFVMEYIKLPRGDEINYAQLGKADSLILEELKKAIDLDLLPGEDVRNPFNFFYDIENERVRLIDFERWSHI